MVKFSLMLESNRDQIFRIARCHGVERVRVFGSAARGDATPESDIDLLVVMGPGRSLLDLIGFRQDIEELLGKKTDVVSEAGLSPYLRNRILQEAVAL